MYVVGLTGGIGSGKTAASDWFLAQGIEVVDADVIARQVVQKGQPALAKIAEHFGSFVLTDTGELNRSALRERVFASPKEREVLESITHPKIYEKAERQLAQASSAYVVLVAPLLLESGQHGLKRYCHRVLVVDVPVSLQVERATQRDSKKAEHIQKIIQAQMPREERLALADDVVDNSKDLSHLYAYLEKLHVMYMGLARPS